MTPDPQSRTREIQKDARAWARFTGTNYTAALRQMTSPLAQGFLGERVSARQLVDTLQDHPVIGSRGGPAVLGENGYRSATPWTFHGETDFVQLALITDMLRMFAPIPAGEAPQVGSYSLKHTAERFLIGPAAYVPNGRLIWAAAAMGLPISAPEEGNPNLLIGVPEREHDYVSRMARPGSSAPRAHHHRPAGYEHLQAALRLCAQGEPPPPRWTRPAPVQLIAPLHDWLIAQADRGDAIGQFGGDYEASIHDGDHAIARTPEELLRALRSHPDALETAEEAVAEWVRTAPPGTSVRTVRFDDDSYDIDGLGTGSGAVERLLYRCPCGEGEIIEEHDSTPGHREHDVRIDCSRCSGEWQLVFGRSVRDWALQRRTSRLE